MRKIVFMSVLLASATGAIAQTAPDNRQDDHQEILNRQHEQRQAKQENHRDQLELQHQTRLHQQELKGDMLEHRHEVREQRLDARDDRRDLRRDHDRDDGRGPVMSGYRMAPVYLSGRYDVHDYSRFGVESPGAGFRWVRYGHDLVLVNVHTSSVVRVIRNRF